MKKCPKCKSVIDDDTECTVCGATITYEPYIDADRESVAQGMWLKYWAKKLWLSVLSAVFLAVCLIICRRIDKYIIAAFVGCAYSFISVILAPRITEFKLYKYNEDFAKLDTRIDGAVAAVLSLLISVASMLIK